METITLTMKELKKLKILERLKSKNQVGRIWGKPVWQSKKWIFLRRPRVITLFSPSFGVIVERIYFLMHDKAGIEEVALTCLQSEFKELMRKT